MTPEEWKAYQDIIRYCYPGKILASNPGLLTLVKSLEAKGLAEFVADPYDGFWRPLPPTTKIDPPTEPLWKAEDLAAQAYADRRSKELAGLGDEGVYLALMEGFQRGVAWQKWPGD